MKKRAQAGLEYLMTYGWAMVIIATVVGILVFVVSTPAGNTTFNSSDPAKIPIKAGNINESNIAEAILQNLTGGAIKITMVDFGGSFSNGTLNGTTITDEAAINPPIEINAGGELHFQNINYSGTGIGTITIHYTDYASLTRQLIVNGKKTGGTAPECDDGSCNGDETCLTCPSDCGDCPPECGDASCNGTENASTCPDDCPAVCPDTFCTHTENASTCPDDCPAVCGDDYCTHSEDGYNCHYDCSLLFVKTDYGSEEDCLHDVCITRGDNHFIYNSAWESVPEDNRCDATTPSYTSWAAGSCGSTVDFGPLISLVGCQPPNLVGNNYCLYLDDYHEYFDVVFHSWTSNNNGGGFSYTRTFHSEIPPGAFVKTDYGSEEDFVGSDVYISRGDNGFLYNSYIETGPDDYGCDVTSPAGTSWAAGSCSSATNFGPLISLVGCQPPNLVGNNYCLYLDDYDERFDIEFHSWTIGGSGGGFSYTRTPYS